jgi:hypothetical protein
VTGPAPQPPGAHGQDLLEALALTVPALVPDGSLEVVRARTVGDRLAGRPGRVPAVTRRADQVELTLAAPSDGGPLRPQAAHVVRGVVLSRRSPDLASWLQHFGEAVTRLATARAGDARAAADALAALGVAVPAPDVEVPVGDVTGGLRSLPSRVAGLVPDDVAAGVGRTCAALLEALVRAGTGPVTDAADLPRRTATDYLPRTLRAYLALPAAARTTPLADGRAPVDVLREQVGLLEDAAVRLLAGTDGDAVADLLANGLFLRDRFAGSDLDGPAAAPVTDGRAPRPDGTADG